MTSVSDIETHEPLPAIRRIGFADLRMALISGLADFRDIPSYAVFLCLFYPLAGLLIGGFMLRYDVAPLLFPLAAGFALIGPFAAIGLYELSRRRELGMDSSWQHAFDVFRSPARWAILEVGVLLLAIFFAWLLTAQAIYADSVGKFAPRSAAEFFNDVFTTSAGWQMFVWGNVIGLVFAVVSMCISVISFPLLLDRNVSAAAAILTSVRAVIENPKVMIVWGLIVGAALFVGSVPFLLGLAVVMPFFGHATWHLYRRLIPA